MVTITEQSTQATSKNKRHRKAETEVSYAATPLSSSRKEARLANSARVEKDKTSKPNQASLKMAKRLKPISGLLASLPKPIATQSSEFASFLLSRSIEFLHAYRRYKHHVNNPDVNPNFIHFTKFKLTCKAEYEDSTTFKSLAKQAANIIEEAKQSLRVRMVSIMKMELDGDILKLQTGFITELAKLLGYWVCYRRALDPDNQPPFSNAEGGEELLQDLFKQAPSELFTYLHARKKTFLSELIAPHSEMIKYIHNDSLTEVQKTTASEFLKSAASIIFPCIPDVTYLLFDKYVVNQNIEVAISRTEAFISNNKSTSITAATATAIDKEESVKPKQLVSLIKDTSVDILDNKIKDDIKASKKKKGKKRRKKRK